MQIDPPGGVHHAGTDHLMGEAGEFSSDDANTPLQSPKSQNTSREEDESSNANESDCKSPSQRYVRFYKPKREKGKTKKTKRKKQNKNDETKRQNETDKMKNRKPKRRDKKIKRSRQNEKDKTKTTEQKDKTKPTK